MTSTRRSVFVSSLATLGLRLKRETFTISAGLGVNRVAQLRVEPPDDFDVLLDRLRLDAQRPGQLRDAVILQQTQVMFPPA